MGLYRKLFWLLPLVAALAGCIKKHTNPPACDRGLLVHFYAQTPCQSQPVYPEQISDILVCIFDENDVLVTYTRRSGVRIAPDYYLPVETGLGTFSVVAWSGIDSGAFDLEPLVAGTTRKSDLLLRLHRRAGIAEQLDGRRLYTGTSQPVTVVERYGDQPMETAAVNLTEVTNRITVQVVGLPGYLDDYGLTIEAANGALNIDRTPAPDEPVTYVPLSRLEDHILTSRFTLLELYPAEPYTFTFMNLDTGEELYRADLLQELILRNPGIDLACDHDFTIVFTFQDICDCGTFVLLEIRVNDWVVHSYETEF